MTKAIATLLMHIKAEGLPKPELEYKFHPDRKWRFDLAWPGYRSPTILTMVSVEIDGGVFARKGARKCRCCGHVPQGGHNTGVGFTKNCEKLNAAAELGWRVFRYTPQMVELGEAIRQLKRVLL